MRTFDNYFGTNQLSKNDVDLLFDYYFGEYINYYNKSKLCEASSRLC